MVAEYAIACALAGGTKAFYTTPLKALSNQKYGDFVRAYGADRVGLLTGDNAINGDAPVVVMTTEVLRNMIYAGSQTLDGLRYVVLDEVHYLQDRSRGAVWEEVIIHLPADIDIVALSATVSNAEEVAAWMQTVRGATETVIEERRPVDLVHLYLVGDRGAPSLHLLPTFVDHDGESRPNPVATRLDGRNVADRSQRRRRLYKPWRTEVVERLAEERMLPAIAFVFSRTGCDQAVEQCLASGIRLTDADERRALRAIAERHVEALSDADLDVLGYDTWLAGMEAGIAAHHAGLVPPMKEAVEEGFSTGLLKVVFATETLALGINMPARSVVIEKLSKFTGRAPRVPDAGGVHAARRARRAAGDRRGRVRRRAVGSVRAVRAGRGPRVAAHVRADVVVSPDVQHGRKPRAAVPATTGAPPAEPVVRAVPRRPRRRRGRSATWSGGANSWRRPRRRPCIRPATCTSTGDCWPRSTRPGAPRTASRIAGSNRCGRATW